MGHQVKREKDRFDGPTSEHMRQDDVQFETGDDKQGTITYRKISRLEQTYNTWRARVGTRDERNLSAEFAALTELGRAFIEGGMLGSVGSVDLDGTYSAGVDHAHMSKTERQLNDRDKVYKCQQKLNSHQWTVVTTVVFDDQPLIAAGYAIGAEKQTTAYRLAGLRLKESGEIVSDILGY